MRMMLASESKIQKYKVAVIMGSILRNEPLPPSFYDGIKHYLDSYLKQLADGKKKE